jgi:hypothetical protein
LTMSARVAWSGGGTATIVGLDGDRITLDSDRPFAPGSRPEGTLETPPAGEASTPAAHRIWVKVHASKRQDDGTFRVNGRLMNPTRELRQVLKGVVPSPIGGKSSGS